MVIGIVHQTVRLVSFPGRSFEGMHPDRKEKNTPLEHA